MKRPNHILARDSSGKQLVILEFEPDDARPTAAYELPNRAKVNRRSETEFVIVKTGAVLIKTRSYTGHRLRESTSA